MQIDNVRPMIGVKRSDRVRTERIRELVSVCKGLDEVIDESTMRWYEHIKIMDEHRMVNTKERLRLN